MQRIEVLHGNNLDVLPTLPDCSVSSVVTDPPYELGFMGKSWDASGIAYNIDMWREVFRVLKPGGHLLAFGGSRTYHRLASAVEDAGFEIRDQIMWVYGSGFPKSLSVHKATLKLIESRYGNKRCDCVDSRDGRPDRDNIRRESWADAQPSRGAGAVSKDKTSDSGPQDEQGFGGTAVSHLREDDDATAQGRAKIAETVLLEGVCERGTEAQGFGRTALRGGMEEQTSGDSQAGQSVPGVRNVARDSGQRVARSSHSAVPIRGNEQSRESGGPMRFMSSQDRMANDIHAGSLADKRDTRRLELDGETGGTGAICWVCSWCGLPDPEYIASLEPLGSALKPSHEPVVVARKPLEGTVAANVLKWGTGALNIDGTRVEGEVPSVPMGEWTQSGTTGATSKRTGEMSNPHPAGRWPANFIHDGSDEVLALFPDSHGGAYPSRRGQAVNTSFASGQETEGGYRKMGDSGSAARFFYCAKAGKKERNAGLEHLPMKSGGEATDRQDGTAGLESPRAGAGRTGGSRNHHPTVKPIALMRYLIRLVTPPSGTVLDPFAGSGTTLVAATLEGFNSIGIEMTDEYLPIIEGRIAWAKENMEPDSLF